MASKDEKTFLLSDTDVPSHIVPEVIFAQNGDTPTSTHEIRGHADYYAQEGESSSAEDVFETREVVREEGDKKKIRYTRKISAPKKKADRHCHSDRPAQTRDNKARNKIIIASVLCLLFMVMEIVGGLIAGSLAIISDAAHLLTDFASFMISLLAIYLASRPATRKFNYGWHRAEVLGAFTSVLLLWILTGVLAYEAVDRLIDDDYEINSLIMLIIASVGVGFNIILGTVLHQHSHSHGGHGHSHGSSKGHGHGHSHGAPKGHGRPRDNSSRSHSQVQSSSIPNRQGSYQNPPGQPDPADDGLASPRSAHAALGSHPGPNNYGSVAHTDDVENAASSHFELSHDRDSPPERKKNRTNINVKAAFIHVVGDFLQSLGVLTAALIIYFKPEWKMADPICTLLFSLIVVVTTFTIMRDILVVLMEGKPRGVDFSDVRETLLSVDKVKDTHNLRMWSLTMDKTALSVHLVVDDNFDPHEVLRDASQVLRDNFDILDITIQIEEYVADMDDCNECVGPS